MKSSLRISSNFANPQAKQTSSAPVIEELSTNHIIQEQTSPANPHLDFSGGVAKWRFDNSKLQRLAN